MGNIVTLLISNSSSFISSKSKPRLKFSALQLSGSMGGLDLPNIKLYQWSEHLRYVCDQVALDNSSTCSDLEQSFSNIWKYAKSISLFNRAKTIQFKTVHWMHILPNRRHSYNHTLSPLCFKCKTQNGTLSRSLWSCNQLQIYWAKTVSEMSNIFDKKL